MFYKSRVLSGMFFNPPIPGLTHFQEARYIRACSIVDTWTKNNYLTSIYKRDLLEDLGFLLRELDCCSESQKDIHKWCNEVLLLVHEADGEAAKRSRKRAKSNLYTLPTHEERLHIERVELITESFNINKFSFVPQANKIDFLISINWLADNSVNQSTKDWAKEALQLTL